MNPLHIVADKDKIAKRVIFPGDPLRAKYIAENFLENPVLINNVRNMLGYTGTYKGKKVTVIGSGMGIPSASLYAYELYKFYGVEKIIRVGTAGTLNESIHANDIVLGTSSYSHSNFRYALSKKNGKKINSSNILNQKIINVAEKNNIKIIKGCVYTSEVFDPYEPIDHLLDTVPHNIKLLASEMEAFGIFSVAEKLGKEATCLLHICDSKFEPSTSLSTEERQIGLNRIIYLALKAITK